MIDHPTWLVRVLKTDGTTAGTGIAIDDRHVITCAHLPAGPNDCPLAEGLTVLVEFPFAHDDAGPIAVQPHPPREAEVLLARQVELGWADFAVLRLPAPVPGLAPPRLLRRPDRFVGRPVTVRGFPFPGEAHAPDAAMELSGHPRAGWVQLNPTGARGWTIDFGFSGGPVWDNEADAVIGMTVAKSGSETGAMIALDYLAELWPALAARLEPFPPIPGRRLNARIVSVMAAVLVLAAMVLMLPHLDGESEDPDPTGSTGIEGSESGGASPAAEEVTDFQATVTSLNNVCARVNFAEGMEDAAAPFLDTEQVYSADEDVFIGDALAAGAYASGSLIIEFTLQTELDHMVTVYDIKVVVSKVEPITMHSHIGLETCGGGEVDAMTIPLGAADPGPFVRDEYGEVTNQRFFDSKTIKVSPTEKPYVLVEVGAFGDGSLPDTGTATAYEFTLEIEYEVAGETDTLVIDLDRDPFKISTGQECFEEFVGYGGLTSFNEDPSLSHFELGEC